MRIAAVILLLIMAVVAAHGQPGPPRDIVIPPERDPHFRKWLTEYQGQGGALQPSPLFVSWEDSGGIYTQAQIVATSPLLTNGVAQWSADHEGDFAPYYEISFDGSSWTNAYVTTNEVYFRVGLYESVPPPGTPSATISNIIARSFTRPDLYGNVFDIASQILLTDTPTLGSDGRQVATKAYVDGITPSADLSKWAEYPAIEDIKADGKRIILGGGWAIQEENGFGFLSYADVWASTNMLVISHDGSPIITAEPGIGGLHINSISIDSETDIVTLLISTNGVVSEPFIQYTANLMAIDWQIYPLLTNTYPIVTNGSYMVQFNQPETDTGFFRAMNDIGIARIDLKRNTYVDGYVTAKPGVSPTHVATVSQLSGAYGSAFEYDADGYFVAVRVVRWVANGDGVITPETSLIEDEIWQIVDSNTLALRELE